MRLITTAALQSLLLAGTAAAASCPGYSVCPVVNYRHVVRANPKIAALLSAIDTQEAATVAALNAGGNNPQQTLVLVGQAMAFDKSLSARRNEACTFCHEPAAGFSGGIKAFDPGGGIFPGSVTYRTGNRLPQSLAYAAFSPPLALTPQPVQFVGGNFWDSRATGAITGIPAADQVAGPLSNPVEMALPDPACAVRRVAISPFANFFTQAWGNATLAINWPANTDKLCATPNDGGPDQTPLALSPADRAQATTTLNDIGLTIASYEASPLASPFTSKFDAVQAGKAKFTKQEEAGLTLFGDQGKCIQCHASAHQPPLFTAWESENDGTPHNPVNPFLTENVADPTGYIANSVGTSYTDPGLGGYLASSADTNPQWQALAPQFLGTFQVPTLRNVAAQPANGIRHYMHNGFFTSLAELVHFYNTRDVLPTCTGTQGIGVTCWPAPETSANESKIIGNLGLSSKQEAEIVAFLGTLTDGYTPDAQSH